jgi:hypothetical protein
MNAFRRGLALAGFVTLAHALPAIAQDALCAGIGANGQWIGGTEGASDITTATTYQEQMALVLAGNEYVSLFSVSAPTEVRVEAAGRGGGDPLIDLYDGSGGIVLSDDDSGGEGSSRGETTLQPGTYCLAMKSFDGAPMTGFVRVGRTDQEALTAGVDGGTTTDVPMGTGGGGGVCDASTQATMIGDGPIDSSLSTGATGTGSVDQTPYWRFTLGSAAAITITAENLDADPMITLYDSTGGYVGENDDFDGLNSRLDMTTPLAAGDYCVSVQALSNSSLPITLTITGYDPAAALLGQYERAEAAPPLDGSYPITALGTLTNRMRQDTINGSKATWFSVDIPESGLLLVEAISSDGNGDPYLLVFDDLGRNVAENDDNGGGLDSMVSARVNPGTYLIALKEVNEGTTGPVRMLLERYVAAK